MQEEKNKQINQTQPVIGQETEKETQPNGDKPVETQTDHHTQQHTEHKHKKEFFLKRIIKKAILCHHKTLVLKWLLIILVIFSLGAGSTYLYLSKTQTQNLNQQQKDQYLAFLLEIYDNVKDNYWNTITDQQLGNIYRLGTEKLISRLQDIEPKTKDDVAKMLTKTTKDMDDVQKKDFTVKLAALVLANLEPFGRSGLFTTQDEENLKNRVQNVDLNTNLYDKLGVDKNSSNTQIKQAFDTQSNKLAQVIQDKNATTDQKQQAQQQLDQVNRAFDTLSIPEKKDTYDKTKIEATAVDKLIRPDIFYLKIKQLSPQTFDEFQKSLATVQGKEGVDTLIIDLRGNFGGAIDILPYFLGPFIGNNQYAYDFFHKGDYTPFKTRVGFLPSLLQYKKVVILVDNQTQSSAEVMAATFKKYHTGILLGTATKGWGTVERVFPIKAQFDIKLKYSMLLVHSLTVRDDGQPIEGKGVEPDININDTNWQKKLYAYFHYDELAQAIGDLYNKAN